MKSLPSIICRVFCLCSLMLMSACAAARPPVPVGTIPEPVPITPQEETYGQEVLQGLSKKWELDYNHPRYPNVVDIVERLTKAIQADKDPWHVYVLKDDSFKNAAATRGNHVFIWTGMINATNDDDELATIIGHEIGHVLARHSDPDPNESMREMIIQAGAMAAGIAIGQVVRDPTLGENAARIVAELSRQAGNAIAVYPYSRDRELEADHIGLFLLAEAKYDPAAAIRFWERAAVDPAFSSSLAFLSTHPPADERLDQLRKLLPAASARYQDRLAGRTSLPPGEDSFNVSSVLGSPGANTSGSPPSAAGVPQSWEVLADRSVLYGEPNFRARALGEFSRGARIEGIKTASGWVEISRPDSGFLWSTDLAPISGKR